MLIGVFWDKVPWYSALNILLRGLGPDCKLIAYRHNIWRVKDMSSKDSGLGFGLDVKQAVEAAKKHAQELYGTSIGNLLLEEVELVDDTWRVTLSFIVIDEPLEEVHQIGNLFGLPKTHTRHYKEFLINALTGKVLSMKIRQNA